MNRSPEVRPPSYPIDLERHLTLADGRRVFVRPVIPEDASMIVTELERADPETVYQRFFRVPVRLDPPQLTRLTHLDYRDRLALAAFADDGSGVAITRYETIEPGVAEVAVVVNSDWRGAGLGTSLLDLLERAAADRGVHRLTAVFLPGNDRVASLLERRGFALGPLDGGLGTAEKLLPVPA